MLKKRQLLDADLNVHTHKHTHTPGGSSLKQHLVCACIRAEAGLYNELTSFTLSMCGWEMERVADEVAFCKDDQMRNRECLLCVVPHLHLCVRHYKCMYLCEIVDKCFKQKVH